MSQDYLFRDPERPQTDHPDSAIRLAAVVHRFRIPTPLNSNKQVCFTESFRTTSQASEKTSRHMKQTDQARALLEEACAANPVSAERILESSKRYQPLIHTVLLSCQVQPEMARLDQKLYFEWISGIEQSGTVNTITGKKPKPIQSFTSEALMYELCMTVATTGIGYAWLATEHSMAGDFTAASNAYQTAAAVFQTLSQETLPKWVAAGSDTTTDSNIPMECQVATAGIFKQLFQANRQQMAVAALLMRPGTPNYTLLSKLCMGIHTQLEDFIATMRREAFGALQKLDSDFLTLVALQIAMQQGLSLYFSARAAWDQSRHGVAIGLLYAAQQAIQTRSTTASAGIPDVSTSATLRSVQPDVDDFRKHLKFLLQLWEKDNSSVFFETVPQTVPAEEQLTTGHIMELKTPFELDPVDPVLLQLPDSALQRSDSDLARELEQQWNAS